MRPLVAGLLVVLASIAGDKGAAQGPADKNEPRDFPPGAFSDGNSYRLADLKGKVVVLHFFEPQCPVCRAAAPEKNELVKSMAGQPVKFLAIGVNIAPNEAVQYQRSTKFEMPIFADTYGLMEKRYGLDISLKNIYQTRIIDTEGNVVRTDLTKESVDKVIARSKPEAKFTSLEIDAKFLGLADLFESGQFSVGMKNLTAARKTAKKGDLASLKAIQDTFKQEGAGWVSAADAAAESDPIGAYDLYAKAAAHFATDDIGKTATKAMKKFVADKSVKAELAARVAYGKLAQSISTQAPPLAGAAAVFADIAKKHAGTPTGEKAQGLAEELGYKAPAKKK
jgi:thiol-disulfide isomerase/thioredoxin